MRIKPTNYPPLGASDHNAVQLVPTYICKHSKYKRKQISNTTLDERDVEQCRASFDTTDWTELLAADTDTAVDTVSEYINFTVATNSTTKSFRANHNSKPWLTKEISEAIKWRYEAKKHGDSSLYKCAQKTTNKLILTAKQSYKDKILNAMSSDIKVA